MMGKLIMYFMCIMNLSQNRNYLHKFHKYQNYKPYSFLYTSDFIRYIFDHLKKINKLSYHKLEYRESDVTHTHQDIHNIYHLYSPYRHLNNEICISGIHH